MKSITVHKLDDVIVEGIEARAKAKEQSLNATIKELLAEAAAFEQASADFEKIDDRDWESRVLLYEGEGLPPGRSFPSGDLRHTPFCLGADRSSRYSGDLLPRNKPVKEAITVQYFYILQPRFFLVRVSDWKKCLMWYYI